MINQTNWYDFDDGYSIGTSGSDGGLILRDEEHQSGARITLEEDGSFASFSITCGIYGWMFHTRYFSEEAEAIEEFELMKVDLDEILKSFVTEDEADEDTFNAISGEISEFVEKYP
ncbi:MAG TPA: hypothetical protein VNI60_04800 [Pyrinomonadaceae bacterium]|nr:hypothetical protein [Pyrinomonadaceae bacterium]